jgi:hypothetical protein
MNSYQKKFWEVIIQKNKFLNNYEYIFIWNICVNIIKFKLNNYFINWNYIIFFYFKSILILLIF